MQGWTGRIIILVLFGLTLGVPFLLQPAASSEAASDGPRLTILTPHNEQIRYELSYAYNAWRQSQGQPPITFDWRASGGTSDLRKQVLSEFTVAIENSAPLPTYDLFFGGGDYEHNQLARGVTIKGQKERVPVTRPLTISDDLLREAFPSETIAGVRLYHVDKRWVGIVLSSFGIIYNNDRLKMAGLPEPTTWSDLADPRYQRSVALADPAHSGSIAVTYNAVLQRHGWVEGWGVLRRTFANARYFTNSASKVPVDVSAGESTAGMCIDFYGRFQAGAIGGSRVDYVDPVHMTVTTPDPISVMDGTRNEALANDFVAWLLTKDAQQIWMKKLGTPGGPQRFELRRSPIRHDLYEPQITRDWVVPANPFEIASPVSKAVPDFYFMVAPISHAIAIDIHEELQHAWRVINAYPDHPLRAEMLAKFDAMPPLLTIQWPDDDMRDNWQSIADDPEHPRYAELAATLKAFVDGLGLRYDWGKKNDVLLADRQAWTAFFKANYEWISDQEP